MTDSLGGSLVATGNRYSADLESLDSSIPSGNSWSETRREMLKNGYSPILVRTGGKRAVAKGWPEGAITEERLTLEEAQYPHAESTGLRLDGLLAWDNDVDEPELAAQVQKIALGVLGYSTMERVGDPNRRPMTLYKCDENIPSVKITAKLPGATISTTVCEFRSGSGSQIVAYGCHPSGTDYYWPNADLGSEPTQMPKESLPLVTGGAVEAATLRIRNLLAEIGATDIRPNDSYADSRPIMSTDLELTVLPPDGRPVTYEDAVAVVARLEPDAPRDEWIKNIAAIRACPLQDDDDESKRRVLAHQYSEGTLDHLKRYEHAQPSRYDDEEAVNLAFDSMPPKPGGISWGTAVHNARKTGYVPSPAKAFEHIAKSFQGDNASNQASSRWEYGLRDPVADASLPPIKYRDENRLWMENPEGTITQVIAAAKCHKTNFVLSELMALVSKGKARGLVLALEGGYGIRRNRLPALARHFGVPLADLVGRFQVCDIQSGGMFDLSNDECVSAFIAWLKTQNFTDVFIDTQHRAAGKLEENSATDARILWNAAERLKSEAGVHVIFAHHKGKDPSKGGRGSSADLASVDQQIELDFDRAKMTVDAKVTARKDGEDGFTVSFKIESDSETSVPILVPMSNHEMAEAKAADGNITIAVVQVTLGNLRCYGQNKACSTSDLARAIQQQKEGFIPGTSEADANLKTLANKLCEFANARGQSAGIARKAGSSKTGAWEWFLPESDRPELKN